MNQGKLNQIFPAVPTFCANLLKFLYNTGLPCHWLSYDGHVVETDLLLINCSRIMVNTVCLPAVLGLKIAPDKRGYLHNFFFSLNLKVGG